MGQIKASFIMNANKTNKKLSVLTENDRENVRSNSSTISIDHRLLYGLLSGLYHWNNAEVGSLYSTRRNADFNLEAQNFLNFLAVI